MLLLKFQTPTSASQERSIHLSIQILATLFYIMWLHPKELDSEHHLFYIVWEIVLYRHNDKIGQHITISWIAARNPHGSIQGFHGMHPLIALPVALGKSRSSCRQSIMVPLCAPYPASPHISINRTLSVVEAGPSFDSSCVILRSRFARSCSINSGTVEEQIFLLLGGSFPSMCIVGCRATSLTNGLQKFLVLQYIL